MTITAEDIAKRVDAGFTWLLETRPSAIAEEIDLNRLAMHSACNCVVGQIVCNEAESHPTEVEELANEQEFYLEGYDDIVVEESMVERVKDLVGEVNELNELVMSHHVAIERGFHVGADSDWVEWDMLTSEWIRRISDWRAANG